MPLLAALLSALATQLFNLLAYFFARRVGVVLAAAAALATIMAALYAAMRGVIAPLAAQLFSTSYGSIIGLAFPPVAGTCMVAFGTTWAACALYTWQRANIRALASG